MSLERPALAVSLSLGDRVERVEILLEPFDDIVPRDQAPPPEPEVKQRSKKKKEKKNFSLLSFGEEAAAEDASSQQVCTHSATYTCKVLWSFRGRLCSHSSHTQS